MVSVANNLLVESITATLQPVRMPGSRPKIALCPAGAASNKSRKLLPNTVMASASALSRKSPSKSVSRCSCNFTRQLQRQQLSKKASAARPMSAILNCWAITVSHGCGVTCSNSSDSPKRTINTPSLRPRNIAKARCDGMFDSFSSYAK